MIRQLFDAYCEFCSSCLEIYLACDNLQYGVIVQFILSGYFCYKMPVLFSVIAELYVFVAVIQSLNADVV